ncbi:MAG: c-type cytochrome [Acidobacteria bacterium]|nr:c-type cytochrome [Acidobacteriota bacterium]
MPISGRDPRGMREAWACPGGSRPVGGPRTAARRRAAGTGLAGRSLLYGLLAGLLAPCAAAAQDDDDALAEQGQRLYEQQCALCHGSAGEGRPPAVPALRDNERLGLAARTVRFIRQGAASMPPFPALTAAEVAALASHVRTAWTNDFGSVTTGEVADVLDGLADGSETASVWDGVFTEAQAARGRDVYTGACGLCHGRRLNGAPDDPDMRSTPPLARARFLREWEGRSLAVLLAFTRLTMPEDNPGSLTDAEYVDVIAYMLSVGRMPAGGGEIPTDSGRLAEIVIGRER